VITSARARTLWQIVLIVLILVNVFEVCVSIELRRQAKQYFFGSALPKPSGYSSDGRYVAPPSASCFVLRVSSDYCSFCRLDEDEYLRLVERAKESGCEVVVLAPKLGQLSSESGDKGAVQLWYIDFAFGRSLVPYATPQTILLDRNGRVLWFNEGALDQSGLSRSMKVLANAVR